MSKSDEGRVLIVLVLELHASLFEIKRELGIKYPELEFCELQDCGFTQPLLRAVASRAICERVFSAKFKYETEGVRSPVWVLDSKVEVPECLKGKVACVDMEVIHQYNRHLYENSKTGRIR